MTIASFTTSLVARGTPWIRRIVLREFLIGLIPTLIIGGMFVYWTRGSASQAESTSVVQVERRTLISSVKAAGTVTFASEQTLKFNQKGTVAKVFFREGDRVKKNQIIAQLDATSVLADIRQAQLSVGASALQLQQLQADKEKTILDAQNTLDVSQQKLPSDLAAAERAVTEKKAALDQATLDLQKQKTTEIQSMAMTAQTILTTSDNLLDSTYNVLTLGRESRPKQGTYDLIIDQHLYRDDTLRHKVEDDYVKAVNTSYGMHSSYPSLVTQQDAKIVLKALADAEHLAQGIYALSSDAYGMLQGATTDTKDFTASDLDGQRSTLNTNESKAADLLNQALTAQANLAAVSSENGIPSLTLKQKQQDVVNATNALTLAQENLQVMKTQTPGDLLSKQKALDSTKTSVDVNIKLKQNDIGQRVTTLQKTQKTLEDYQLKAPFDGIVTHIDYKVGDNLLDTGDTESLTLQNPDLIVVTIPLDQVDIVRVHKGLSGAILFDALPNQTFIGTIDSIDSTPITTSGVVSYNVSITLPSPKGLTILSGMTATVQIETTRKENVVAVPNLALRTQNGRTTVLKADGTSAVVETGDTDGRYTEILSGLNEGDGILAVNVVTGQSASSNANAAQQFLRAGGGGFSGGGFGATGGRRN